VIGLTATAPDDMTADEAALYEELLGPVDFQTPTPAVVREGLLASSQELPFPVWVSNPMR
jgi:superfamily II DNA or RNA helicase